MEKGWSRLRGECATKLPLLLLLLFLSAKVATATSSAIEKEGVMVLDSKALGDVLNGGELLMLNFCAPWANHCTELEPEYAAAAKELEKDGLLLGKVNCDANEDLCREDRWDLAGYPAVKVVRGNTVHDYIGPWNARNIAAFMRQVAAFDPDDESTDEEDDELEKLGLLEDDGFVILGSHNFDAAASHFVLMMVLFHRRGCDGCAELEVEYRKAADELYQFYIPLTKVDCFAQKELCEEERWAGAADDLPAIMAVRDDEMFEYGDRPKKAYNMVAFMKKLAGIDDSYFDDDDDDADDDDHDSLDDSLDGGNADHDGDDDVPPAAAASKVNESNVMTLDSSNFEKALRDNEVLLIEFYAPWCGNCQRLQPRYAKAADALVGEGIRLAKVDCQANEAICSKDPWRIEAYPTIFLQSKGRIRQYEGATEKKDIAKFMRKAVEPSPLPLENAEGYIDFLDENSIAVIGFLEERGGPAHELFKAVADKDETSLAYGVLFDRRIRAAAGVTQENNVIVFKENRGERVVFSMQASTEQADLESFVRAASKRLVLKKSDPETAAILMKRPLSMFLITEDEETPSASTLELLEALKALAAEDRHPVTYVHAVMDDDGEGVFDFAIGLNNRKGNVPAIFYVTPGEGDQNLKYLYGGEITLSGLKEFERQFFAGELKPHIKSESLTEARDNRGPVKVVKALSFERMVLDNDDDVLLEFYAPWCQHCKRLEPIYNDFATKVEGAEKLVIAKINKMANDVEHPTIRAKTGKLPAIFLFKANAKDAPIQYFGAHDVESLEEFVREHAHHNLPWSSGSTQNHTEL